MKVLGGIFKWIKAWWDGPVRPEYVFLYNRGRLRKLSWTDWVSMQTTGEVEGGESNG